jgi:hypothetical protein
MLDVIIWGRCVKQLFFLATATSETLKKKNLKKIDKQKGYVQLKLAGFC